MISSPPASTVHRDDPLKLMAHITGVLVVMYPPSSTLDVDTSLGFHLAAAGYS